MKIGNVEIMSNAFMAPMAGFTDVGFRDLVSRYGAGLTYTEMVSCKGIYYGSEKTCELLATTDRERPVAAQVFGCDPDIMAEAVRNEVFNKFNIIDVNMGCPVPKIFNNKEGSYLINEPKIVGNIISSMVAATSKPITVKTRLGIKHGDIEQSKEMIIAAQEAGAAAIAVHGRTREQYYSGKADWDAIARLREVVNVPLIANGDIYTLDDYIACIAVTGADAVMIGRGAIGNPQLFRDIALHNNQKVECNTIDPKRDIITQINTLKQHYDDRYIYTNMKKHICAYARGRQGVNVIKDKACRTESLEAMLAVVEEYF